VQNSFEVELAFAGLEKILEGGAQKVHHHHVALLVGHGVVGADVVEPGDASCRKWGQFESGNLLFPRNL